MLHHLLPFLIFCFSFSFHQASTFSSNETDYRSLLAFKSAINLDSLGALSSWNGTTHFCSWNGIECNTRHKHRVIAINLTSQGLLGSLSPHIGNLSLLTSITLKNNSFHGIIPRQITHLTRLEYVEFSYNSFTGTIPSNLSRCFNLSYLNLLYNRLSGAIPTELAAMSKLEALGLGANRFSGHIPPFLGNITSLTKLSLIEGGFTGEIPPSLAQLHNLKFLSLAGNSLTGTIPPALFNISAIRYFWADNNRLHGSIPSNIGLTLPNLTGLDLSANRFTGPVPPSLSNASLLEVVQVYENYFSGPLPRMGSHVHLYSFGFQRNLVSDDVTSFFSPLTNSSSLRFLEFGGNSLTGSLPESIANFSKKLMILDAGENYISGKIPSGIGNLENLAELYAWDNFLEGEIPVEVGRLSNLRSLLLGRNLLSESLRFSFHNFTFLTRVYLNENDLAGNVPSSLANCSNLLGLDLSRNNFHGVVPPPLLDLSSFSITLNFSYNNLEGSIPHEVGSLRNLAALDLSNNKFSGSIPNSLSKCISMEKLYLNGNSLQGEIPLGLSGLGGLQELDLSMNSLSGPIPSILGRMQLHKLNLSFNRLQGEVPTIGVFKNVTRVSVQGNEGICGGIPELKLSSCPSLGSEEKKFSSSKKILIPILVFGGICIILLALVLTYKRKLFSREVVLSVTSLLSIQIMRLSYLDLLKATGGFSESNLIGFGKFGSVYKAILEHDQTVVAVKVLDLVVRGSSRSFLAECNALRNARHRNLLRILSVCDSIDFHGNEFKALVYEFKPKGSLEKWLHRRHEEGEERAEANDLSMMQRLDILIDVAQAMEYLHFGTDSSIVHGDLKPSNILLDEGMNAYVGDFGLARVVSDESQHEANNASSGIRGTIGYLPPEYGTTGLMSTEGDVYSYGVVLLEMFTNLRPTDDLLDECVDLRGFVRQLLPDRVTEAVDAQLRTLMMSNEKVKKCMAFVLSIGLSCSQEFPGDRMSMADVVIQLHMIQKLLSK